MLKELEKMLAEVCTDKTNAFKAYEKTIYNYSVVDEVHEAGDSFKIFIELPGINKESISVDIENNILTVKAVKQRRDVKDVTSSMILYGDFNRKYTIKTLTKSNDIQAKLIDGVLEITIPKADETKARKINIQ